MVDIIGIDIVFDVPDVDFDPEALDYAMMLKGFTCKSQCDHHSFVKLQLGHCDFNLAAIDTKSFARLLEKWFKQL